VGCVPVVVVDRADRVDRQLARDLLGDLRRVDARLADNKAQLREALAATGSTLTQVHGLG
jgi:transposase